jgi:prophage regulatory protein
MQPDLLTYPQLRQKGVPYTRMHLRRLERAGGFPRRVPLSEQRVAWVAAEIDAWIKARIAKRDVVAAA